MGVAVIGASAALIALAVSTALVVLAARDIARAGVGVATRYQAQLSAALELVIRHQDEGRAYQNKADADALASGRPVLSADELPNPTIGKANRALDRSAASTARDLADLANE
jgi:hypothetical protein